MHSTFFIALDMALKGLFFMFKIALAWLGLKWQDTQCRSEPKSKLNQCEEENIWNF
jgi:hypothetical protein